MQKSLTWFLTSLTKRRKYLKSLSLKLKIKNILAWPAAIPLNIIYAEYLLHPALCLESVMILLASYQDPFIFLLFMVL